MKIPNGNNGLSLFLLFSHNTRGYFFILETIERDNEHKRSDKHRKGADVVGIRGADESLVLHVRERTDRNLQKESWQNSNSNSNLISEEFN